MKHKKEKFSFDLKDSNEHLHNDAPQSKFTKRRLQMNSKLVSIADQIAESDFFYRNWKYKEGEKHFPEDVLCWFVDKCYPYAKNGMLLVDEPRTEQSKLRSYAKRNVLKKLGYRFIIIEMDSDYYHCLEQLGEI